MKVESLIPIPNQKFEFNFNKLKFIPNKSGCYSLTNFQYEIIYVGLAKNLQNRIKQHLENPQKIALTTLGMIYWIHFIVLDEEKLLGQTERGWLNQYKLEHGILPLLNKIESPIS